ncbi:MAG TPA: glutamate--tRNA ligase [Thermoclostridium sp.]
MSSIVRTRYAPSPTGYIHIGNLRSALYEYLIARVNGGKFILRIEDTDQERYIEGAVDVIYRTLKLCGLKHDEGPDIGGPYGPYIQSERKNLYLPYAEELVRKGHAYYCFCSKERLESLQNRYKERGEVFRYDRHCLGLSEEEVKRRLEAGEPYVIRQKMPTEGTTTFHDVVYGEITVENSELEDQILIKSDGYPTYNFANVIDDHLMNITHVVRGCEYLSSTPKYNLLYQAFGWEIPTYVHLPLIVKPDGSKISKRKGDATFEDLLAEGYLVEAIINYLALLGWSPDSNQEIFSLAELEKIFSIERISKSPSVFDMAKLRWFNGEYIRAMSLEDFHEIALPWIKKGLEKDLPTLPIAKMIQPRTEVLSEIPEKLGFFNSLCEYDLELYTHKKMKTNPEISLKSLKAALPVLENLSDWSEKSIYDALMALAEEQELKSGQVFWPLRIAVSGQLVTPGGAVEIAEVLGKEETIRRINIGIERLSAVV